MVFLLLESRKITDSKIKQVEEMQDKMIKREIDLTYRVAVDEAEYQMKRKIRNGFYDSLMPRLKVKKKPKMKRKKSKKQEDSDSDYFGDLIIENEKLKTQIAEMKEKNKLLDRNIDQLKEELDVVKWYTEVLDSGIITKDLYINMMTVKKQNRLLEEKIDTMKLQH